MRYRWTTILTIALWLGLGLATVDYNGPFFDEATQITAGLRALEGHGLTDGYLIWFGGSLFWPVLAGLGFRLGGLVGTRIVALLLAGIAFTAVVGAASNLYGRKVALWTAAVLALNGPFLSLARLGVYDVLALPGVAVAFWAATMLHRRNDRAWLVLCALALTLVLFAKYPLGIMFLPIAGLIWFLRGRRALMDLLILSMISGGLALAFFLPVREQLAQAPTWQFANKPTFGTTLPMIAYAALYWSAAPFLLALGGWRLAKGERRVATVLLGSLAIWPAFHLLSANPVSLNKTIVFGFLLAAPLAGRLLGYLDERGRWRLALAPLLILLAGIGLVQWKQLDYAWPDLRPSAQYLAERVQPGDRLLIDESWPFVLYLYSDGRIASPWDVYDVYRITHNESPIGLCEFDWYVNVQGSYAWPAEVAQAVEGCGRFRAVHGMQSMVTGLGTNLSFITYPVKAIIWTRNDQP